MTTTTKKSFCRFCHANCPIVVTVEDGRATKVVGNPDNPIYAGYSCVKGRALPQQHLPEHRILRPLVKRRDGSFDEVSLDAALDELAARVGDVIGSYGPRAVANYLGTGSIHYPVGQDMAVAFLRAIGSPMNFNSSTIDQPGKLVASTLHGNWGGGARTLEEADAWLFVGTNPPVSMWAGGPAVTNPRKQLREARQRGMRIICADPRRTELARVSDLHLALRPGEDVTLLAGILHVLFDEGLVASDFLSEHVDGVDDLRRAVEPFTPTYVERRAHVPAAQLLEAAHVLAASRTGGATAGTGTNMAPRGGLSEYLLLCIITVCGWWRRAGDVVPNPGTLVRPRVWREQAEFAPGWELGHEMRVRGLTQTAMGMPTGGLAEEMLLEGDGRVRALISMGGNPVTGWPDQAKTLRALDALDLFVTLDIQMNESTSRADFLFPTKLSLEVPGIHRGSSHARPYAMYTAGVVDPPAGAELLEEWQLYFRLAARLGVQIRFRGVELDMADEPSTDELYVLATKKTRVPLEAVIACPDGYLDPGEPVVVETAGPGEERPRLQVGDPTMTGELAAVAAEPVAGPGFRLTVRRLFGVYNSTGRRLPALATESPAYMHPSDLDALGLHASDLVVIESDLASVTAVVEPDDSLAPGVISMAHGFGVDHPDDDVRDVGASTARLVDTEHDFDPRTGMPVMSAVPVRVRRAVATPAGARA